MASISQTRLKDLSLVVIPPPPSRFARTEWELNINFRKRSCLDQQKLADAVIAETDRSIDQVNDVTTLNKKETDQKLIEKLENVKFLKSEIEKQRKEVCTETENLNTYIERLNDCLKSLTEDARKICMKCLILREGRLGIDFCYDEVERELQKEFQIIDGTQNLLRTTLEQASEEVRRLRSTTYNMDRDLEDKDNTIKIDMHNSSLNEKSLNLSIYHGLKRLDNANITNEEWNASSMENIEKAAKEINSARLLRSYVDTLLRQAYEDLCNQYNMVNGALRRRIEEIKDVKTRLEVQHSEVQRQINEMTRAITRLDKAIAEKEAFMALAHTRLGNRTARPGNELCKDAVELSLVTEVGELNGNVAMLQAKLAEARASLRYLLKTQIQLEEDINIKTNSLKIDEVDCMTIRQSMVYHAY